MTKTDTWNEHQVSIFLYILAKKRCLKLTEQKLILFASQRKIQINNQRIGDKYEKFDGNR